VRIAVAYADSPTCIAYTNGYGYGYCDCDA